MPSVLIDVRYYHRQVSPISDDLVSNCKAKKYAEEKRLTVRWLCGFRAWAARSPDPDGYRQQTHISTSWSSLENTAFSHDPHSCHLPQPLKTAPVLLQFRDFQNSTCCVKSIHVVSEIVGLKPFPKSTPHSLSPMVYFGSSQIVAISWKSTCPAASLPTLPSSSI